MKFMNFMLLVELLLLYLLNLPTFFSIPYDYNRNDSFFYVRNKQIGMMLIVLIWRLIDFILIMAGDTVRINVGTCMLSEQLMIVGICTTLWLEVLLLFDPHRVNVKKLTLLSFLFSVLLTAPSHSYEMFKYTPNPSRAFCCFISPADTADSTIWLLSAVRLLLSVWLPTHILLLAACRRNMRTLFLTTACICVLLYTSQLWHKVAPSTTLSYNESSARVLVFLALSLHLNNSVKYKPVNSLV